MTEEQKYFRFNGIELKKENDKLMLNTLIQSPSEEDMKNIKKMLCESKDELTGGNALYSKYKGGNQTQKYRKKITKKRKLRNRRNTMYKQFKHNTTFRV